MHTCPSRARALLRSGLPAALFLAVVVFPAGRPLVPPQQGPTTPVPELPSYAAQKGRLIGLVSELTALQRREEAAIAAERWSEVRTLAEQRREGAKEALRQLHALRRSWSRDTAAAMERLAEAVQIAKDDVRRFGSFDGGELERRIRGYVASAAEAQRANDTISETLNTFLARELFERKRFLEWSATLGGGGAVGQIDLEAWRDVQEYVMEALEIQGYELALTTAVRNSDANMRRAAHAAAGDIPRPPVEPAVVTLPGAASARDLSSIRAEILEGLDQAKEPSPRLR